MKKDKKIGTKSLYTYLSVSFVIILIIILVFTAIYFSFFHQVNREEIKNIIGESEIEPLQNRLRLASIYGIFVGVTLILVVASHIIRPIRKITMATKKVATGDLNTSVDIKRRDEIGDLADNFNKMVKELNSIEYLRKDFISSVSHELKTPIASIQGFAKLLQDENISKEERKEYIDIIIEETSRLSNLTSNIIKLSKFENQEIINNKKEYRLDEQIRKAIIMLDEKINEKHLTVNLKAKEIYITKDQDLLMEIWLNLLDNAIKYSNIDGAITINIIEEKECVKVKIKDNGIGIKKEKQDRIFEKFYQADKSHSTDGGGLGLAIVKRIVDLIDGRIELESEENKGTTFSIYIKNEKKKVIS